MSAAGQRPINVLIAALGGEGGGVLADWLLGAALADGYAVQSTSIPGVAQRTGATTYYIELFPANWETLGERRPVFALTPTPGDVDVMVASELIEAGRAMQNGYVNPQRTTLIASTHRIYATSEKMVPGDGRYDSEAAIAAAARLARRAILGDMVSLARQTGSVINAVLLGAIAGSGALPMSRRAYEQAVRGSGKAVEANLRGFDAGLAMAASPAVTNSNAVATHEADSAARNAWYKRVRETFPQATHSIIDEAAKRLVDYQDAAYAGLYLDRLKPVLAVERGRGGVACGFRLTNETARWLALWMSFEDVIRVAQLKSRPGRIARIRREVGAREGQPVEVVEYLKPGLDEWCAILPRRMARVLAAAARSRGWERSLARALRLKSASIVGHIGLRTLAGLKTRRPRTSRYAEEQALIQRWLKAVQTTAEADLEAATEVAHCARLVKGYGETRKRGVGNLLRILDGLGDMPGTVPERAMRIRAMRESALADAEGMGSDRLPSATDTPPSGNEPVQPLLFVPRKVKAEQSSK